MANLTFTQEIAEIICERIANGEGLRSICRDNAMPGRTTVLEWLNRDEAEFAQFRAKYARARENQADYLDEEMQEVADAAKPDDVRVARLRVLTMQWRASKLAPKKYGDKVDFTTAGKPINDTKTIDSKLSLLLGKAGIDFAVGTAGEDKEPE